MDAQYNVYPHPTSYDDEWYDPDSGDLGGEYVNYTQEDGDYDELYGAEDDEEDSEEDNCGEEMYETEEYEYHQEGHGDPSDVDHDAPVAQVSFFQGSNDFNINAGNFTAVQGSYYNVGNSGLGNRAGSHSTSEATSPTRESKTGTKHTPQYAVPRPTLRHKSSRPPTTSAPPPKPKSRSNRQVPEPSFFECANNGDINGGTFSSIEGSYCYEGPEHEDWRAPPTYTATHGRYTHPESQFQPDMPSHASAKATNNSATRATENRPNSHRRSPLAAPISEPEPDGGSVTYFENASNFVIEQGNFMIIGGNSYAASVSARPRSQTQPRYNSQPESRRARSATAKGRSEIPNIHSPLPPRSPGRTRYTTAPGPVHSNPTPPISVLPARFTGAPQPRLPRVPNPANIPNIRPPRPPRVPSSYPVNVSRRRLRPSVRPTATETTAPQIGTDQRPNSNSSPNVKTDLPSSYGSGAASENEVDTRKFTAQLGNLSVSYERSSSSTCHSQARPINIKPAASAESNGNKNSAFPYPSPPNTSLHIPHDPQHLHAGTHSEVGPFSSQQATVTATLHEEASGIMSDDYTKIKGKGKKKMPFGFSTRKTEG